MKHSPSTRFSKISSIENRVDRSGLLEGASSG